MTAPLAGSFDDLEPLQLEQLEKLQQQVTATIQRKEEKRRAVTLQEIARLADQAGLTAQMVGRHLRGQQADSPRRRTAKLPPKYRDPQAPANRWAGRGKQPKWLKTKMAAGASLDDFLIAKPEAGTATSPTHADAPAMQRSLPPAGAKDATR